MLVRRAWWKVICPLPHTPLSQPDPSSTMRPQQLHSYLDDLLSVCRTRGSTSSIYNIYHSRSLYMLLINIQPNHLAYLSSHFLKYLVYFWKIFIIYLTKYLKNSHRPFRGKWSIFYYSCSFPGHPGFYKTKYGATIYISSIQYIARFQQQQQQK